VVEVDAAADDSSASAGAAALLALPWELLADNEGYLFEGALHARVVRRIPRRSSKAPFSLADRLRVGRARASSIPAPARGPWSRPWRPWAAGKLE
jgi:hypothetical protein